MLVLGIVETVRTHTHTQQCCGLDGVGGAFRLLADVALKALVSDRMLPVGKQKGRDGVCLLARGTTTTQRAGVKSRLLFDEQNETELEGKYRKLFSPRVKVWSYLK